MIIPIRCLSCGKPIAHLYKEFKEKVSLGEEPGKALDDLKIDKYCCRAIFLGQTDILQLVNKFKKF